MTFTFGRRITSSATPQRRDIEFVFLGESDCMFCWRVYNYVAMPIDVYNIVNYSEYEINIHRSADVSWLKQKMKEAPHVYGTPCIRIKTRKEPPMVMMQEKHQSLRDFRKEVYDYLRNFDVRIYDDWIPEIPEDINTLTKHKKRTKKEVQ